MLLLIVLRISMAGSPPNHDSQHQQQQRLMVNQHALLNVHVVTYPVRVKEKKGSSSHVESTATAAATLLVVQVAPLRIPTSDQSLQESSRQDDDLTMLQQSQTLTNHQQEEDLVFVLPVISSISTWMVSLVRTNQPSNTTTILTRRLVHTPHQAVVVHVDLMVEEVVTRTGEPNNIVMLLHDYHPSQITVFGCYLLTTLLLVTVVRLYVQRFQPVLPLLPVPMTPIRMNSDDEGEIVSEDGMYGEQDDQVDHDASSSSQHAGDDQDTHSASSRLFLENDESSSGSSGYDASTSTFEPPPRVIRLGGADFWNILPPSPIVSTMQSATTNRVHDDNENEEHSHKRNDSSSSSHIDDSHSDPAVDTRNDRKSTDSAPQNSSSSHYHHHQQQHHHQGCQEGGHGSVTAYTETKQPAIGLKRPVEPRIQITTKPKTGAGIRDLAFMINANAVPTALLPPQRITVDDGTTRSEDETTHSSKPVAVAARQQHINSLEAEKCVALDSLKTQSGESIPHGSKAGIMDAKQLLVHHDFAPKENVDSLVAEKGTTLDTLATQSKEDTPYGSKPVVAGAKHSTAENSQGKNSCGEMERKTLVNLDTRVTVEAAVVGEASHGETTIQDPAEPTQPETVQGLHSEHYTTAEQEEQKQDSPAIVKEPSITRETNQTASKTPDQQQEPSHDSSSFGAPCDDQETLHPQPPEAVQDELQSSPIMMRDISKDVIEEVSASQLSESAWGDRTSDSVDLTQPSGDDDDISVDNKDTQMSLNEEQQEGQAQTCTEEAVACDGTVGIQSEEMQQEKGFESVDDDGEAGTVTQKEARTCGSPDSGFDSRKRVKRNGEMEVETKGKATRTIVRNDRVTNETTPQPPRFYVTRSKASMMHQDTTPATKSDDFSYVSTLPPDSNCSSSPPTSTLSWKRRRTNVPTSVVTFSDPDDDDPFRFDDDDNLAPVRHQKPSLRNIGNLHALTRNSKSRFDDDDGDELLCWSSPAPSNSYMNKNISNKKRKRTMMVAMVPDRVSSLSLMTQQMTAPSWQYASATAK